MLLADLAVLKVSDINVDQNIAVVLGKGNRRRFCQFGHKTAQALERRWHAGRGEAPSAVVGK
jgi:site-specific recombinase XerD